MHSENPNFRQQYGFKKFEFLQISIIKPRKISKSSRMLADSTVIFEKNFKVCNQFMRDLH